MNRERKRKAVVKHFSPECCWPINEHPVQQLHFQIKAADEGTHCLHIDKNPTSSHYTLCQTRTKQIILLKLFFKASQLVQNKEWVW